MVPFSADGIVRPRDAALIPRYTAGDDGSDHGNHDALDG